MPGFVGAVDVLYGMSVMAVADAQRAIEERLILIFKISLFFN
jgi:hypothetical protein